MTEQAPITDFSRALVDFNSILAARSVDVRARWKELRLLRDKKLEELLEEKGLAVCSYPDHNPEAYLKVTKWNRMEQRLDINSEELKKLKPEDLGIYPKDQVRLHFSRYTISYGADPFLRERYQIDKLELLCPAHYPNRANESRSSDAKDRKGNDVRSEVEIKDGGLITKVGSIDVTDSPIEHNYNELIYKYFDLPELPQEPK